MKAVVILRPGGPEVLSVQEVPTPVAKPYEVLVRVRSAGLNRADLLQREGKYPAPPGVPADIPGLEYAGTVEALGPEASRWKLGSRVFGITAGGAQAEFVTVHESTAASVPDNLDWSQAGAIPEAFITAHDALYTQAKILAGESVLIHAVGSGVGIAAVQLVCAQGAIPFGTSRTKDKIDKAREYGLNDGITLAENLGTLREFVSLVTSDKGFNVVLDLVGGAYTSASLHTLARQGRMVVLSTSGGRMTELDLGQLLSRRAHIMGSVLRARTLDEKIAVNEAFVRDVVPLFASNKIRVPVEAIFPMSCMQEAHALLSSNKTFGKVVIMMD